MTDSTAVKMYRCIQCGKWSHAKRKPKTHERWVSAGDPRFKSELVETPYQSFSYKEYSEPKHPVVCGPFELYLALPLRELVE